MNSEIAYPFSIRKSFLVALLATAISLLIPFLIGGKELLTILARVPPVFLIIITGVAILQFIINAIRVKVTLGIGGVHVSLKKILKLLLAIDAADQITPSSSGGIPAAILLTRQLNLPVSTMASVTIFLGFLNGLAVLAICTAAILFSLVLQHSSSRLTVYSLLILAIMAAMFFLSIIAFLFSSKAKKSILRLLARMTGRRSPAVTRFWLHTERQIYRMISVSRRHLLLLGGLSLAYWICRLSMLFTAILIIGEIIPWQHAALIQIAGGVVGLVSGLPAGLIGADLAQAALLSLFMDSDKVAASLVLWRFGTFHLVILTGLPILLCSLYKSLSLSPENTAEKMQ